MQTNISLHIVCAGPSRSTECPRCRLSALLLLNRPESFVGSDVDWWAFHMDSKANSCSPCRLQLCPAEE